MPFSVNNVDLTVNANSLFGLISFIQSSLHNEYVDMNTFYDDTIKKMIVDVTDFLVWAVESRIVKIILNNPIKLL